jgi:protein-disulfide isomerase
LLQHLEPRRVPPPFYSLFATLLSAQFIYGNESNRLTSQLQFLRWYESRSRDLSPVLHDPGKVSLVAFIDYECPSCAVLLPLYERVLARYGRIYPERLSVRFMDFPLEPECNRGLQAALHEHSCEAAAAVRLIRDSQGDDAAKEVGNRFYRQQPQLTSSLIRSELERLGLSSLFEQQYPRLVEELLTDTAVGNSLGVSATPTFFINGAKVPVLQPDTLELILDYEFKRLAQDSARFVSRQGTD